MGVSIRRHATLPIRRHAQPPAVRLREGVSWQKQALEKKNKQALKVVPNNKCLQDKKELIAVIKDRLGL